MTPRLISRSYPRQSATAAVASVALLFTAPATALGVAAQSQPAPTTQSTIASDAPRTAFRLPRNVRLRETHHSRLAQHRWYRQYAQGYPVYGAWWALHRDKVTGRVIVFDGRRKVGNLGLTSTRISEDTAVAKARKASKSWSGGVTRHELMVLPASRNIGAARLTWAISTADGDGARTSFIDASTGGLLNTVTVAKESRDGQGNKYQGTARVFDPNPVVKLQNQGLRDLHDSAKAVPRQAYTTKILRRMDGSKQLSGRWVRITNRDTPTSRTRFFRYNRANDYFEQSNAYYSVDMTAKYLHDLGFRDVNAERQKVATNAFPEDNSYYNPANDQIALGSGGVDDAEDAEVIWHEYGHAIQDAQVPQFGLSNQAGAIGEGFGDYMAVLMSQQEMPRGTPVTPTACVMDWDATSYTTEKPHCLRRTDKNKFFTPATAPRREVHEFGEVWSRALWDMNQSMGRNDATRVVIEGHFWMSQRITMPKAAKVLVAVARKMSQRHMIKPGAVRKVRQAMLDRRILT